MFSYLRFLFPRYFLQADNTVTPKAVIFVDNRFRFHFDQVAYFFKSGFFSPEEVVVFSKFYPSSYRHTLKVARQLGITVRFFNKLADIPKLSKTVVFYPYNGQANCRMLLNRDACHVFLTHGESNKKASINPMVRIYDYVLACGNISVDRYLDYGILSQADVDAGKVIRIGDCLIENLSCIDAGPDTGGEKEDCILYMPTWEGGLEDENFSSVAHPNTFEALKALAGKLGVSRMLVQSHPNLGGRLPAYRKAFYELLCKLHDSGIKVSYMTDEVKGDALYRSLDRRRILQRSDPDKLRIRYGVADVSASEAMLAAKRIPTLVLYKADRRIYAPRSYLQLRKRSMLDLDQTGIGLRIAAHAGSEDDLKEQEVFFDRLLSYSSEELRHMSNRARFAWLYDRLWQHNRPSVSITQE